MGALRTYQKRFERQAGQRLERSLGEPDAANLPSDFMDLLERAEERRRSADGAQAQGSNATARAR